jgi:hypothetical protein
MFDWARAACRGSRSPYAPIFRLPSSLTRNVTPLGELPESREPAL